MTVCLSNHRNRAGARGQWELWTLAHLLSMNLVPMEKLAWFQILYQLESRILRERTPELSMPKPIGQPFDIHRPQMDGTPFGQDGLTWDVGALRIDSGDVPWRGRRHWWSRIPRHWLSVAVQYALICCMFDRALDRVEECHCGVIYRVVCTVKHIFGVASRVVDVESEVWKPVRSHTVLSNGADRRTVKLAFRFNGPFIILFAFA